MGAQRSRSITVRPHLPVKRFRLHVRARDESPRRCDPVRYAKLVTTIGHHARKAAGGPQARWRHQGCSAGVDRAAFEDLVQRPEPLQQFAASPRAQGRQRSGQHVAVLQRVATGTPGLRGVLQEACDGPVDCSFPIRQSTGHGTRPQARTLVPRNLSGGCDRKPVNLGYLAVAISPTWTCSAHRRRRPTRHSPF